MHTKIICVLLGSLLMLSIVGLTNSNNANAPHAFAQPFDITTEQTTDIATITVQLAQPNQTVVIPPNGSIVQVPATNITVIDNDTVIIVPENETVTQLPGNVTVITPPEPEPCGCPTANEIGAAPSGGIAPVVVQPAPGQEVITENGTQLIGNESQTEPIPVPEPEVPNGQQNITEAPVPGIPGNETITVTPEENETVIVEPEPEPEPEPAENNNTGLSPAASFAKMLPWWETT